jgi:class 3 adenylate cyclase
MSEQVQRSARRELAAIMFTDVVQFSSRMSVNEELTLKLVHRDLEEMRRICAEHEGRVIKNTGDGLLMLFSSAVQAVAAGLLIQKTIAEAARTLPAEHVLQHRIGIHLGDVFVADGDVLGDGVNIAARLQTEAEPGGICISQTTYDVVKNRLPLEAASLGPRELKNIAETIAVYRIRAGAGKGGGSTTAGGRNVAPWWQGRPVVIGGGVALVAMIVIALQLSGGDTTAEPATPTTPAAPAALPAPVPPTPLSPAGRTSSPRLAELLDQIGARLAVYTAENPLMVRTPPTSDGARGGQMQLWMARGTVHMHDDRGERTVPLSQIPPQELPPILGAMMQRDSSFEMRELGRNLLAELGIGPPGGASPRGEFGERPRGEFGDRPRGEFGPGEFRERPRSQFGPGSGSGPGSVDGESRPPAPDF